jgi:hypothetical protein
MSLLQLEDGCPELPRTGITAQRGINSKRQGAVDLAAGVRQHEAAGFAPILSELSQKLLHFLEGQTGVDHDQVGLPLAHHLQAGQATSRRADDPN